MEVLTQNSPAYTKRRIYWKAVNRVRASFVKQITRVWESRLNRFLNGDFLAVADAMKITYVEVGSPFARNQFNKIVGRKALGDIDDQADELMARFARDEMAGNTQSIQDTTNDLSNDIIALGLGATATKLAIDEMIKRRAAIIAQNEIVTASNVGQKMGADLADAVTPEVLVKVWVSTIDARIRDAHDRADGETVKNTESFVMTGEALDFPKDPSGSAGNTINCFTGDQLTSVNKKDIKKIYRSLYIGKVVTIKTESGNEFTCTPNHPILTTIGFIKAGNLNESHNLIKSESIDSMVGGLNVENVPSTFEEIYNSFSEIGSRVRVVASSVNFYGDIPASDVDIIRADSILRGAKKSPKPKKIYNYLLLVSNFTKRFLFSNSLLNSTSIVKRFRLFSHSLVSFFSNMFEFTFGSILKPQNISFASIPSYNISISKDGVYGSPRSSDIVTYSQDTCSVSILSKDIFYDSVVSNFIHDFNGYVYTLETVSQIYDINDYIARNCRCVMQFQKVKNN